MPLPSDRPSPDQHVPRHPIRVAALRSGLDPAVIRAWESRYRAIEPHRSDGGERLYSDTEVERLELLRRATEAGRRISQVAALDDEALRALADGDAAAISSTADPLAQASSLLQDLAPHELATLLETLAGALGPERLAREVLRPVLASLEARPSNPETRRLLVAPRWQPRLGTAPRLDDLEAVRSTVGALPQVGGPQVGGISAGEVHALLLVQEVLHHLLAQVRDDVAGEGLVDAALQWLEQRFGAERVEHTLHQFEGLWGLRDPTQPAAATPGRPQQLLELLLVLWLANRNPAFSSLRDLLDDSELEAATRYRELVGSLAELFAQRAPPLAAQFFPAEPGPWEGFEAPAEPRPTPSPKATLEALLESHEEKLGSLADRVKVGLGILAEEHRLPFAPPGPPPPPTPAAMPAVPAPPAAPPERAALAPPRRIRRPLDPDELPPSSWSLSKDAPWMPPASLVAKHTLVWLDQLSRVSGTEITRLDQIPDQALAELREHGFDALWLVGLWERSLASRHLARAAGRVDAAASAYAVRNYQIAENLGGWEAAEAFAGRCGEHGLILGCDLVPNHTAIDSDWVIERPELFVQTARPPFPNYRFSGENLSADPRVELRLEDGYATGTDAAVVFERRDLATDATTYIYHGNDGTGLPWKDTAQLDYTLAEVRATMIEQIVTIARHFRMIRFDAAMTLTRRHFHRLWYPAPGSGGAIPSRSERGLSQAAFDARMPKELWAEVVAEVAAVAPETMLVAEAFWLMEPYFVRSLGIHRVYHSAFMHGLRDGRNGDLQEWVAAALEREPAELSRYVNFLTTPDETPAAESFGTGDRYFAAATILATLPGLPLFGHGQVEGLGEKYGMEFARAYLDEVPDPVLVARHDAEIAPLLEGRELFADPSTLRLLEVSSDDPHHRDVWAYTNQHGTTAALVVVNHGSSPVEVELGPSRPVRAPWGERSYSLSEALGVPGATTISARDLEGDQEELDLGSTGRVRLKLGPWQRRVWKVEIAVRELPAFGEPSPEISAPEPSPSQTSATLPSPEPAQGPPRTSIAPSDAAPIDPDPGKPASPAEATNRAPEDSHVHE